MDRGKGRFPDGTWGRIPNELLNQAQLVDVKVYRWTEAFHNSYGTYARRLGKLKPAYNRRNLMQLCMVSRPATISESWKRLEEGGWMYKSEGIYHLSELTPEGFPIVRRNVRNGTLERTPPSRPNERSSTAGRSEPHGETYGRRPTRLGDPETTRGEQNTGETEETDREPETRNHETETPEMFQGKRVLFPSRPGFNDPACPGIITDVDEENYYVQFPHVNGTEVIPLHEPIHLLD